jgi:hypothetical protein
MATIEESLVYPLILLLAGGGISVGLGTWLTHWFENRRKDREIKVEHHRKELETKVDLLSKMAEEITNRYGNALFYKIFKQQEFSPVERNTIRENDMKWFNSVNVIRSKLQCYYLDTNIGEIWNDYFFVLDAATAASREYFSQDQDPIEKKELKKDLARIKAYFSKDKSIKWDNLTTAYDDHLWSEVLELLRKKGDEIMKNVLKLPIKTFKAKPSRLSRLRKKVRRD